MPTVARLAEHALPRRPALFIAGGVLLLQLILLGLIFNHSIDFTCQANWPGWACSGASGVIVSIFALSAALLLYFLIKPEAFRQLTSKAGQSLTPIAVNAIGFAVALVPVAFLREGTGTDLLFATLAFWTIGFAGMLVGVLLLIAPIRLWHELVAQGGLSLGAVVIAGLVAPILATALRPVWKLETISSATFHLVASITETLGYTLTINDPIKKWIGTEEFLIAVAPQCSGVEGIALVTLFVTIFLALFRSELRFPRALLLYPAGIAVSMLLNVVRITVLLIIGLEGNAELAIGGFHSHAGWMMFTLIALGVVLVARSMPFLQKLPLPVGGSLPSQKAALPPLSQDDNAARIVPFAVFMISAIFAQAFSQSPGIVYPLRVVAMAAGLFFFLPVLARITWRPTFTAIAAGSAIGIMWIAVPYTVEDTAPAHGGLAGALLIGWLIARGIGTMLLVPIIEELFFRDYLERKVSGAAAPILRALLGQPEPSSRAARLAPQIFAALVTASLFAILHDRWIEAFIAGLVFSWVMAQRKNVADAVAAHMAANAIVFAYALATMQMHII